jgi:hypothetical protein
MNDTIEEMEETREEARLRVAEQDAIQEQRRRLWAAANDYARSLRDREKKAFAFAYATYKFGTGNEKFLSGGRVVEWTEVWTKVPDRIRKAVYKAIAEIEAGIGERINGCGRCSLRKLPNGDRLLAIRTNCGSGWIKMTPMDADAEGDFGPTIEMTEAEMNWFSATLRDLLGEP